MEVNCYLIIVYDNGCREYIPDIIDFNMTREEIWDYFDQVYNFRGDVNTVMIAKKNSPHWYKNTISNFYYKQ